MGLLLRQKRLYLAAPQPLGRLQKQVSHTQLAAPKIPKALVLLVMAPHDTLICSLEQARLGYRYT